MALSTLKEETSAMLHIIITVTTTAINNLYSNDSCFVYVVCYLLVSLSFSLRAASNSNSMACLMSHQAGAAAANIAINSAVLITSAAITARGMTIVLAAVAAISVDLSCNYID